MRSVCGAKEDKLANSSTTSIGLRSVNVSFFCAYRRVLKYEVQDRAFFAHFRTWVVENRTDATAEIQHGCYVDVVLVVCFRVLFEFDAEPVLLIVVDPFL